jgi:hypothetical protein
MQQIVIYTNKIRSTGEESLPLGVEGGSRGEKVRTLSRVAKARSYTKCDAASFFEER